MSRTPSLDRETAETMLGPRGRTAISVENRSLVRKWLVSCGISSTIASSLSLGELSAAYNDPTDATLRDIRSDIMPAIPGPITMPPPAPTAPQAVAPMQHDANRIAAIVSAVLASMPASVDENAVQLLIEKALHERRDDIHAVVGAALAEMREALENVKTATVRIEIKTGETTRELPEGLYHKRLPDLITAVSVGLYPMLVGPAGSGKTTAAEQAAQAVDLPFYQQPAATGAHDFLGFVDGAGKYHSTPFRQAFEHGGLLCADEIDSGDAGAWLTVNGAIGNGHCSFPDGVEPVKKHPDFRLVACANTYGRGASRTYVGRNQLDAATLDRFPVIDWPYDDELESALSPSLPWTAKVQRWRHAAEQEQARVIISPRASIMGGKLLAAGMDESTVAELVVWKGIEPGLRGRIEARA